MFNSHYADDPAGGAPFGGPGGFLSQLAGGFGGQREAPPPRAYDDHFRAYSTEMLSKGSTRANLVHGGKIIMPPSALVRLTNLELEGPWAFHLRNPRSAALETHAGVLEFIAEEGVVYLPPWMMRTLNLGEGDPIRATGAKLPKGKLVKIQAQNLEFLEVSDPKAVLESCLRNFSCLTRGDIFSVSYNSIAFEFLVMETQPEGPGISCQDTDLEVDFATPKGYVEPAPPPPKAIQTMASKLNIDVTSTTPSSASSASGRGDTSDAAEAAFEAFLGGGRSLNGRRTKGKGLAKKIEEADPSSIIRRTDKARIIPTSALSASSDPVPAALHLPPGKLFFGWQYKPFDPAAPKPGSSSAEATATPAVPFSGLSTSGATLSGRAPRTFAPPTPSTSDPATSSTSATSSSSSTPRPGAPVAAQDSDAADAGPVDPWANLSGGGNTLRSTGSSSKGKGKAKQQAYDVIEID